MKKRRRYKSLKRNPYISNKQKIILQRTYTRNSVGDVKEKSKNPGNLKNKTKIGNVKGEKRNVNIGYNFKSNFISLQ